MRSLDEALAAAGGTLDDTLPEPQFRLDPEGGGANETDARNEPDEDSSSGSSSLFSSRSWQDKVTRGDLTALVREKSRSVQDLMVLTHVEPLSDVEFVARELRERSETVAVDIEAPEDEPEADSSEITSLVPSIPQIAVTSPSFTVRSPHGESDIPLLDNTDTKSVWYSAQSLSLIGPNLSVAKIFNSISSCSIEHASSVFQFLSYLVDWLKFIFHTSIVDFVFFLQNFIYFL